MPPAAPPFPAFEDWKRMSEREQDALLDRLEAKRRRRPMALRLAIGLGCIAAAAAVVAGYIILALA
ncbi:MAG TPA: hypothetical protein VG758_05330 [Hyphomicrobiaceae bacterium]|jgi:hypothetical protein|nr:hypothetical protein [Hyphomicrobiaceae bacterium]